MKKTAIILSLIFMTFAIISCDNADKDESKETEKKEEKVKTPHDLAEEMIEKIEDYTDFLAEMAEDGIVNDDEVQKLEKMTADIDNLDAELDDDGQEILDELFEENSQLEDQLYEAMFALFECEGAEKLDGIWE